MASEYLHATRARRQVWNAVAAADCLDPPRAILASLKPLLPTASAKSLLQAAYGGVPPGFVSCLAKLGPVGLEPLIYKGLFDILLAGGNHAKKLWHAREIAAAEIERMRRLRAFQDGRVAEVCGKRASALFVQWLHRQPAMRGKPITDAAQMTTAAKIHIDRHCMPEDDHDVYRYLWTAIQTHNWAFPVPPWPGSERLTPVRDAASMRKAAKYFRNCLRQHIRPALAGNNAYYLWGGGEPAIVQVKRLPPWGWILWGIAGRANSRVSRETYAAIQLEFKQAPGIHAEWDYNDDGSSNRVITMPRLVMALEDAFGMELE